MMLLLSNLFAFDAIIDLGAGWFQVGTLKRTGGGSPVDAILNSQTKRQTPTIVAYDGEQFHVGEYGEEYAKRNPGAVFRNFAGWPSHNVLEFAEDPNAKELQDLKDDKVTLLISALINHIIKNMINRNDTIDVTLIHPASFTLTQLQTFESIIKKLGANLAMTVPSPVAVTVSHLSTRMKEFDKEAGQQFIIADLGASQTEIGVLRATYNASKVHTEVYHLHSEVIPVGGNDINNCVIKNYVMPELQFNESDIRLKKRVFEGVEKAKRGLSGNIEVRLAVEAGKPNGDDWFMKFTRDQLDVCVTELYSNLSDYVKKAQKFLNNESEIQYIFYGGSSRIPIIQKLFEELFNDSFQKTVNLDEGAIYGGTLIYAASTRGIRLANKFISFDLTNPALRIDDQELYQLNPNMKHEYEAAFPKMEGGTFKTENLSFSVTHQQSAGGKGGGYTINTETIYYQELISDPEYFGEFTFYAYADVTKKKRMFNHTCKVKTTKLNSSLITKKYVDKSSQVGMEVVKTKKLPDIQNETDKYTNSTLAYVEFMKKYVSDKKWQKQFDLKIVMNIVSDSSLLPQIKKSVIQVVNIDLVKKGQVDNATSEFPLIAECETVFNPEYTVPDEEINKSIAMINESNEVAKQKLIYDSSFNQLESYIFGRDDYLAKYPDHSENDGNYFLYATEYAQLELAYEDARQFVNWSSHFPSCRNVECIRERSQLLEKVVKAISSLHTLISDRQKQAQCRNSSLEVFDKNVKEFEKSLANVRDLLNSEKFDRVKAMLQNCEWIDDLDLDSDSWKENENQNKTQLEAKMFNTIFDKYYAHYNLTDRDNELVDFRTKDMIKRLKKANADCSAFNRSLNAMTKKYNELVKENETSVEKYVVFRNKTVAEYELRPVTTCDQIKAESKKVEGEESEMTKKFRDTRSEIDRNRLTDIIKSFMDTCANNKRRYGLAKRIQNNESVDLLLEEIRGEWKMPDAPADKVKMWLEHQASRFANFDIEDVAKLIDDGKKYVEKILEDERLEQERLVKEAMDAMNKEDPDAKIEEGDSEKEENKDEL